MLITGKYCIGMCTGLLLLAGCGKPMPRPATPDGKPRVVSLAPNLTELICAVGGAGQLVGRTTYCNAPADVVTNIPIIGGFGDPSLEQLAAVAPSLILDVDLADDTIGARLDSLGIRRERITCRTLDDIPAAMRRIGALLQCEATAGQAAGRFEQQVRDMRRQSRPAQKPATVLAIVWSDPMVTMGTNTCLSELITLAGGKNLGDEVDKDYFNISSEWVVARNPDVILCFYMSKANDDGREIRERPGLSAVNAVRNRRVYNRFNCDAILRPGPRAMEGLEQLQRAISPTVKEPAP
jgi:iron complex transport system substrate-binding protein